MAQRVERPSGSELGERRLGTIHAVAQALAIGPMFSTALVLGLSSSPDTGASFAAPLAVLLAGLGVLASSSSARSSSAAVGSTSASESSRTTSGRSTSRTACRPGGCSR
jgi:hypothetical protein